MQTLTKFLLIFMLLFSVGELRSQILFPGDYEAEYYKLLTLLNDIEQPIVLNPSITSHYMSDSALKWDIWENKFDMVKKSSKKSFKIIDLRHEVSFHPLYPRILNDGAVWNGKGLNSSLTGGFIGNIGKVHFSFAPIVYYAQNKDFIIPANNFGKSEYSYPFENNIDWVQRYGNDAVYNFNLGQTEIRFIHKNFTTALSTANMTWGPATENPILMSNNAGGFPRIDIGTLKPADTKIGLVEFRAHWGMLAESDYFDTDPANDKRYFTGFVLGYRPNFIPNLGISINKAMYKRWRTGASDVKVKDLFALVTNFYLQDDSNIVDGVVTNDDYDQMASVTVDWKFPEVGFNMYIEYAKNDFPGNIIDNFSLPDRSRAYTLGFVKTIDLKNGNLFKIAYEGTTLSSNQISKVIKAGSPTYYVHGIVDQGYTNQGQIIGAGIGPGSNSSYLRLSYYHPKGMYGWHIRRTRFNDDYNLDNTVGFEEITADYIIDVGINSVHFFKKFTISPEAVWSYRNNFYYDDDFSRVSYQFSLKTTYNLNRK